MKHEPAIRDTGAAEEDDIDRLIAGLPCPPGIRHVDDPYDDEEDIGDIEMAIAEGRAFPHEIVSEWLKTWGKPGRKSFKEWLAARNA